ncbi:MAG: GGDEF domain-containing protein [Candidatus Omnitrophica bacterium]|nr:GGDEF domain-containing protein [Candidatus Omnitrophota bacterium]MCM8823803.1 GGDEF domain-containing protein [Candidatus Omnitrophota bacterium]MCM8826908.1 GGDEF domain-containing protein [Candidatus Omnitrophota bacterium]
MTEGDIFKTVKIKQKKDETTGKKGKGACVIIISGPDLGKVFFIDKPFMIIGREEGVDIHLNDPHVSRRHAQIVSRGEEVMIIDLKSTNGTFVNEQRIEQKVLQDEDRILVGDIALKFIFKDDVETAFHEELYQLASHDGLTQIYNKMYFLKTLEEWKAKKPFSLIMFDIDYFKQINDTYGHSVGDFVLKEIAKIVKSVIRQEDIFARFGGDEYVILMDATKEIAINVAERIRYLIEKHIFIFEGKEVRCTISGGIFYLDDFTKTVLQWIESVDKLLYKAKSEKRNKFCF